MPPRLGYRKSRLGCLRCKQRRVKCDERQPCSACLRHGTKCVVLSPSELTKKSRKLPVAYELPQGQESSSSSSPRSDLRELFGLSDLSLDGKSKRGQLQAQSVAFVKPPSPLSAISMSPPPDPFPDFAQVHLRRRMSVYGSDNWNIDLELLHHYTTVAFRTLPRSTELQTIWQTDIPNEGFKHKFLMHQILALSGCHLAHLRPHDHVKYSLNASRHQNEAVHGMRVALANMDVDNCHALFASASFLFICAFAGLWSPDSDLDTDSEAQDRDQGRDRDRTVIDDITDVFLLIRGSNKILDEFEDDLHRGPFHNLFLLSRSYATTPVLEASLGALKRLKSDLTGMEMEVRVRTMVDAEINKLAGCIHSACATTDNSEARVTFTWPIYASEEFLGLMRSRNPACLAVLACYCFILQGTESTCWYMSGWASKISEGIADLVESPWKELPAFSLESVVVVVAA